MLIICVAMADSVAFLIGDVARLMRKRFDERARGVGATGAQWKALSALSRNQGINQGGLAELLEVEPITLTRMLDRLGDAGLIERRADPDDRRAWRIYLTDAAQPVLAKLREVADELIAATLAGLSEADRSALMGSLDTIRTNLSQTETLKEAANG